MDLAPRHGVDTAAQRFGTGERAALAIHCMLGTSSMWEPVLAPLGATIAATAFDLPGHGKSGLWPVDDTPGAYQTLATRIAASFIDRPVDLIGHSFGAVVALRLAVAAPEAVRSLTLIEPVLFSAVADTPEGHLWRRRQDDYETLYAAGDAEGAARDFVGKWGVGTPWEALSDRHRARFTAQMPIVASVSASNFSDPGQICRPGGFEAIDAPVLLIHGSDSPPVMAEICEAIAGRLPDVGVASVPGAGHMLPLTHARQLSDLIALNLERS